jgi:hypothetical protein
MAIGKISGAMLQSNLDRQGVDLQLSTSNQPLVYFNFSSFLVGINTSTPTETLTVDGQIGVGNVVISSTGITTKNNADLFIAPTGVTQLGSINKVKIGGGNPNNILATYGDGNLYWADLEQLANSLGLDGMNIVLSTPTDGSLVDHAAYRYWTPQTKVTDAIDNLNQVMLNVAQGTFVGQADFTANTVVGPSALTVSFTSTVVGTPNSYFWDFGDGQTSTLQHPVHTYSNNNGGQYTVYFKASNTNGTLAGAGQGSFADITKINYILLYTPVPTSTFTVNDTTIDSGTSVQLTNTSQYAQSYTIFWGDGSTDIIVNNSVPGGVGGGPISHVYTNTNGDTAYNITIAAFSSTAGPSGVTTNSNPTTIKVFSTHTPVIASSTTTGNNQHTTLPNGFNVTFSNNTATNPGSTTTFGAGNYYRYVWGDGTTTTVNIGSGQPGDTGQNITHAYTLIDPLVQQTFNATLEIYNGHSTSPFMSTSVLITVRPAPTAQFTGTVITASDRVGDTAQMGYNFTDLNGTFRGAFIFDNTSFNTNTYTWDWNDGNIQGPIAEGNIGSPTGTDITHSFTTIGNYSVSLNATGPNSTSATDDTLTRNNYIVVNAPPAPPANLGTKTLTIATVGTNAALAAGYTDITGSGPTAGTIVTRVTPAVSPIVSNTITDVYGASSGTLAVRFNGVLDGSTLMTIADNSGIYDSLTITVDRDAHVVWPAIYPSNFYKVFTAFFSRSTSSVLVGYNTTQLTHTTQGSTNVVGFVKDDVVDVPTLNPALMSTVVSTPGTLRYISGLPYFTSGGQVTIQSLRAYDWIGQTYINTTTPFAIAVSGAAIAGTGDVISSQTKNYVQLNGASNYITGGIPNANTGKTSASQYTLGGIVVNVNGSVNATGRIRVNLQNINGTSADLTIPNPINVFNSTYTGFNELLIPVSDSLGSAHTDDGLRIYIAGATGDTPTFNSTNNYYTGNVFQGAINVEPTDEAIIRFGTLRHDVTDYSEYLPTGPNLSLRSGTQYFRFAFRRATMANFKITYTGKISGMWIAAPGTQIDNTSTLNKWLSAQAIYAGAGVPGANTGAGGNGSDGCAITPGDIPTVGTYVVNDECNLTLGSENASNSTGNTILVNIALNVGDYIESISVS